MSAEDFSIRGETWPAPTGSPHDPFDAEHPDNMPACRDNAYGLSVAIELDPSLTMSEWREIRDADAVYPDDVGHDEENHRLHLPIGFLEWKELRDHPCWPEYLDQMRSVPAGETVGFTTWMNDPAPGRNVTGGPAGPSPFLCDRFTKLPSGWVRGDSVSTDVARPYRQVAHDPTRHVVARCTDVPVAAALRGRLKEAGFEPLAARDDDGYEVTYFVRDRSVNRSAVPVRQSAAAGRGAGVVNRAEVVTAAIEHAIPVSRLLLFAELAVAGGSRQQLATVLASYRTQEIVTGAGQIVADDAGITMTGLYGGGPLQVTWDELTGYLAAVIATVAVEDLIDAYRDSLEHGDADRSVDRLTELRSGLAYEAVTAAGLITPSLFTSTLTERVVIDGPGAEGGFSGRVTLDPVDDATVVCRVNGAVVVEVSRAVELHRVAVIVHDGAQCVDAARIGFAATVRHVPPGDSNAPLPATFARRVGAEVLDEDVTGARWVVQVDGFDVVIMEVGNGVAPVVRAAVYDNDPSQPFQRYEGHYIVPATPPRDAGAAVNRLAHLRRPPSTGLGR